MSEENRTNAPEEELTQEDINSLKKIRMDKLEELKAKGKISGRPAGKLADGGGGF